MMAGARRWDKQDSIEFRHSAVHLPAFVAQHFEVFVAELVLPPCTFRPPDNRRYSMSVR